MTLSSFTNWVIGQGSVAKYDDGKYRGQCVSLINQYCYRVLGIPAKSWGHAYAWGNKSNINVMQHFDHVSSPQPGDIGVSGTNTGGGYGHIWIYLSSNSILEQNGRNGSLRVTKDVPYFKPIAILRPKGGVKVSKVGISGGRIILETICGRDRNKVHAGAMDAEIRQYHANQDLTESYLFSVWTSPEAAKAAQRRATAESLLKAQERGEIKTVAQLNAAVATAKQDGKAEAETLKKQIEEARKAQEARDKEAHSFVTSLIEAIRNLFKKG